MTRILGYYMVPQTNPTLLQKMQIVCQIVNMTVCQSYKILEFKDT